MTIVEMLFNILIRVSERNLVMYSNVLVRSEINVEEDSFRFLYYRLPIERAFALLLMRHRSTID